MSDAIEFEWCGEMVRLGIVRREWAVVVDFANPEDLRAAGYVKAEQLEEMRGAHAFVDSQLEQVREHCRKLTAERDTALQRVRELESKLANVGTRLLQVLDFEPDEAARRCRVLTGR